MEYAEFRIEIQIWVRFAKTPVLFYVIKYELRPTLEFQMEQFEMCLAIHFLWVAINEARGFHFNWLSLDFVHEIEFNRTQLDTLRLAVTVSVNDAPCYSATRRSGSLASSSLRKNLTEP